MATLSFNNTRQSGYVVLEAQPENQPYPSNFLLAPKFFLGTVFTSLVNIERKAIVVRKFQMGMSIPEGQSSVTFIPGQFIGGGLVFLRGAGEIEFSFNGEATNTVRFNNSTQLGYIA